MSLKIIILRSLRRLFIILVSLMVTLFSKKVLISTRCTCGFHVQVAQKFLNGIYC